MLGSAFAGTEEAPGEIVHKSVLLPESQRTVKVPFAWKADTWYHLKLQVENLPDGKTRARGKVWAAGESEPGPWIIERVDPIPNREGSPGIYADAPFEVFFDNIKVTSNK